MFTVTMLNEFEQRITKQVDADNVGIEGSLVGLQKDNKTIFLIPISKLVSFEQEVNAGSISDGYHTFDELYAYRKAYNALIFNEWAKQGINQVVKSTRHSDGEECFGGGWFIVSAVTPHGQVSNHYEMKDWDLFQCEEVALGPVWDGHSPEEALERLLKSCKE